MCILRIPITSTQDFFSSGGGGGVKVWQEKYRFRSLTEVILAFN